MTRICINLCLDFLRKRQRQQTDSLDQMEEETGGVERRMEVEDYNPTEKWSVPSCVRKSMRPWRSSATNTARYSFHEFERMEYKEIAKSMQCSIGTVMSRLFYARRRLAKILISLKKERQS